MLPHTGHWACESEVLIAPRTPQTAQNGAPRRAGKMVAKCLSWPLEAMNSPLYVSLAPICAIFRDPWLHSLVEAHILRFRIRYFHGGIFIHS